MSLLLSFTLTSKYLICRRAGFIYQYYEGWKQDLQGALNITKETINNFVVQEVHNGTCQDFFEFRQVGNCPIITQYVFNDCNLL